MPHKYRHQEEAVEIFLKKENGILEMATGTGKTVIAFHIAWKLFQSRWNIQRDGKRIPRILFLADRNILVDQAINTFNNIERQIIKVDKSGINNIQAHSKIIRIALLTPNLGEGLNSINDLNPGEFAWSNESSIKNIDDKSYEILYKNDTLKPWRLILKR